MERVACPVCHIVQERIVLHDDVWVLGSVIPMIPEVRVFYVDHTTRCAYILREHIVHKQYWLLIAFDEEGRHRLEVVYNKGIVELFIRVWHLLEEVPTDPPIIDTDLKL